MPNIEDLIIGLQVWQAEILLSYQGKYVRVIDLDSIYTREYRHDRINVMVSLGRIVEAYRG